MEVLRKQPFDVCARRYVLGPLGMSHTASDPYEAIVHRTAVGHEGEPLGPTPVWALARSNAPAGSVLAMRARDLLASTSADGGLRPLRDPDAPVLDEDDEMA